MVFSDVIFKGRGIELANPIHLYMMLFHILDADEKVLMLLLTQLVDEIKYENSLCTRSNLPYVRI